MTTAAIEDGPSKQVDGRLQYWYFDWYGAANVTGSHSYGQHFQNGGTIFYPEYYDLLDRIKVIGADSALNRWKVLAEEYAKRRIVPQTSKRLRLDGYDRYHKRISRKRLIPCPG